MSRSRACHLPWLGKPPGNTSAPGPRGSPRGLLHGPARAQPRPEFLVHPAQNVEASTRRNTSTYLTQGIQGCPLAKAKSIADAHDSGVSMVARVCIHLPKLRHSHLFCLGLERNPEPWPSVAERPDWNATLSPHLPSQEHGQAPHCRLH